MTTGKTKRQLRAEAAERLKNYETWAHGRKNCDLLDAIIGESMSLRWQENRDYLVGLLTDYEPPESGDVSYTGSADVKGKPAVQAPEQGFVTGRQLEPDTREKLEADGTKFLEDMRDDAWSGADCGYEETYREDMLALLDRQAAITRAELVDCASCPITERNAEVIAGLQAKVDELSDQLALAKLAASDDFKPECGVCDRATLLADIERLEAENADDARAINSLGKQRDHWRRVAESRELPEGIVWPRFESGELVGIGDKMMYDERPERVQGIRFYDTAIVFEFTGVNRCRTTHGFAHGQPVDMAPLLASDGQPIEVGQTLYGLSDGKAWHVRGINRSKSHSVLGSRMDWEQGVREVTYGGVERGLKPEWLTHEEPETLQSVLEAGLSRAARLDRREGYWPSAADVTIIANELANRIEKLAKEGA